MSLLGFRITSCLSSRPWLLCIASIGDSPVNEISWSLILLFFCEKVNLLSKACYAVGMNQELCKATDEYAGRMVGSLIGRKANERVTIRLLLWHSALGSCL